jgi:ATP:ADP antiporter, AAA family
MAHAPDPTMRRVAAQVLGEVGVRGFYQPLVPLLDDNDPEVRRAALVAAGRVQNPKLWPLVLTHLADPEVCTAAVSALAAGGEVVLPELAAACAKTGQPRGLLIRIARICGRIRGERAIALLQNMLETPDGAVRSSVLASLSLCSYPAPPDRLPTIQRHLTEEIANAAWALAAMADIGDDASVSLLYTALSQEIDQIRRRLLFLLSFVYEAQTILRARDHLTVCWSTNHV